MGNKREILKELVLKMNISNAGIIFQILNSKKIDKLLKSITNEKTNIEGKSLLKKKFLSGDEQFLIVLNHFVTFFDYHFPMINYKDLHIEYILESISPEFLFCKKCCEDNDNMEYYQKEMKRTIVYNFYDNIRLLYNDKDKKFWNRVGIHNDMSFMSLSDNNDVEKLFSFLKLVSLSNINEYSTIYLFDNYKNYLKSIDPKGKNRTPENVLKAFEQTKEFYVMQYNILLNNFIKKEDYLDKII